MAATASPYARSYNSFSGVDIKGVFGNVTIAELQAISYSITREKAPIYTMGSADPRSYSRGKRGIAGTLVFIVFDRAVMINALSSLLFQSDIDDIRPHFRAPGSGDFAADLSSLSGVTAGTPVQGQETAINNVKSDQALAMPWYTDQIPPFDVTLAAANEYGALAVMRIFGVELLNEGYGVSIDDIVSEQQHTYVARSILGWTPVPNPDQQILAGQSSGG
jgi:hypothetical protein